MSNLPADQCACPSSSYGKKHSPECYEAQIGRLRHEVNRLMGFMPQHDTRETYRCTECGAFHLRPALDVPNTESKDKP